MVIGYLTGMYNGAPRWKRSVILYFVHSGFIETTSASATITGRSEKTPNYMGEVSGYYTLQVNVVYEGQATPRHIGVKNI